jgi:hypothetical protein
MSARPTSPKSRRVTEPRVFEHRVAVAKAHCAASKVNTLAGLQSQPRPRTRNGLATPRHKRRCFALATAPTKPGIRARFSKPRQPCAKVHATKSCQSSPAAACTNRGLARLQTPAACPWISDFDHQGLDIARDDDVAATAQAQIAVLSAMRVGAAMLGRLPWLRSRSEALGSGSDAEGVAAAARGRGSR